ncbi:hypothetical protein [Mesorhizobium sp. L-2-11]|uniref:hypothetical protein n=1 Tax=Mesorhizobium sp. L-2-11 TaxID=2744521 RepID=UPI0018EDF0B2|nr:hypothetical protein [Mesorhizobium sp. L-2-11]BCH19733.1 hypothetical protein MesoLjLa_65840 [Mesorhizobium sp. L-2-11]
MLQFNKNLQQNRLTCPLCGELLIDNNDQAPSSQWIGWDHALRGERLFETETNGDIIGWASPADLARLLLMRRIPRPPAINAEDLKHFRVVGAIFPEFDDVVADNCTTLPSAGKPVLPINLRPFLLAAVALVEQRGLEMLETLQSHTMGTNRARFGSFVADMLNRPRCRSSQLGSNNENQAADGLTIKYSSDNKSAHSYI